jgi:DNA invertase Pin-like site-specific DNA recombinase
LAFLRAYLRASTKDQNADRAKDDLFRFASDRGLRIAATYTENESGASLARPELFRLLSDCSAGDILLVEQIDRLSRLNGTDWEKLKTEIQAKKVKVVSLDLPTSWMMANNNADDIQSRMLDAINSMMLDMLAAIARKDYVDRRRRQAQGIEKAKTEGRYKGRPEDKERNARIRRMLANGMSWNDIIRSENCSRSTLSRLAKN